MRLPLPIGQYRINECLYFVTIQETAASRHGRTTLEGQDQGLDDSSGLLSQGVPKHGGTPKHSSCI